MVAATEEDGETFMGKSSLTPQQRRIWKAAYSYLPYEVRSRYAGGQGVEQSGSTNITNAIVISSVPEDAPYSFNLKITTKSLAHFREATHTHRKESGALGCTCTQIISGGMVW